MSSKISPSEYEEFRRFLAAASGILLGENKQYLVTSRLSKLMSEHQVETFSNLVKQLKSASNSRLKEAVIDAMTTNETLWFRDAHPFSAFKNIILPELSAASGRLRVWSAACSSGQEPFSLSMLVEEYKKSKPGQLKNNVEIVATDLSPSMIESCRKGVFNRLSLGRGLSQERQRQFFDPLDRGSWQVKDEVRNRVRFQLLNLMDSYTSLGKFDVVFCRNVLIYFSTELKVDILRRIHKTLKPGGYLVLGASESLASVGDLYDMVQCSPGIIYRAK
jgi:chemotaxis protein methyltransferase CheR